MQTSEIYQFHVWLRGISPLIWRRLLLRSDQSIADLHYALQQIRLERIRPFEPQRIIRFALAEDERSLRKTVIVIACAKANRKPLRGGKEMTSLAGPAYVAAVLTLGHAVASQRARSRDLVLSTILSKRHPCKLNLYSAALLDSDIYGGCGSVARPRRRRRVSGEAEICERVASLPDHNPIKILPRRHFLPANHFSPQRIDNPSRATPAQCQSCNWQCPKLFGP